MNAVATTRPISATFAPMGARRLLVFGGIALVAGGMLFATFLNVLFIPVLYVVIQTLRGSGPGPAPVEEGARHA